MHQKKIENHYQGIIASDRKGLIGYNKKPGKGLCLPWQIGSLKNDMQFFRHMTISKIVVMGSKTAQSIGCCLPNRCNMILTSKDNLLIGKNLILKHESSYIDRELYPNLLCQNWSDLNEKVLRWKQLHSREEPSCFVIGGSKVLEDALIHGYLQNLYWSRVNEEFPAPPEWAPVYLPTKLLTILSPNMPQDHWQSIEKVRSGKDNYYPVEIFRIPI